MTKEINSAIIYLVDFILVYWYFYNNGIILLTRDIESELFLKSKISSL